MKKNIGIILIVFVVLLLVVVSGILMVGCETEKYYCGCPYCDSQNPTCIAECKFNSTFECICPDCHKPIEVITKDDIDVITKLYNVEKSQTHVTINVERPEIVGLSDYTFQQVINKEISDSIVPYQNEIAILAEGFAVEADDMISTKTYKYRVTYDKYRLGDYLSVVVKHDIHTGNSSATIDDPEKTDGLRSSEWLDTYVIDVKKNEKVTLGDICGFSDWEKTIVSQINEQADDEGIEIILGNGLEKLSANQKFYIDSETQKLIIYFEPGSIAKYSAGELLFEMPFTYSDGEFYLNIE